MTKSRGVAHAGKRSVASDLEMKAQVVFLTRQCLRLRLKYTLRCFNWWESFRATLETPKAQAVALNRSGPRTASEYEPPLERDNGRLPELSTEGEMAD
jgi:hypothetical protein